MKPIRVLIADDHAIFRNGLRKILELKENIEVVGEAKDGPESLALTEKLKPNIVLMDIRLPKIDGIIITQKIKRKNPRIKIIILSMYDDEAHILQAIQAGASAYIPKELPAKELLKAVYTVHRKGALISPAITPKLLEGIRRAQILPIPQRLYNLTKREVKILTLMAKGKTNKEIANRLYTSEKTVKNQLNSIFQKLRVRNRTQAVVQALDKGLISLD